MAFALLDDQQTTLHAASALDAAGNPIPLVGVITWAVADPLILAITPSADGLACAVVTTGKLGATVVTATATLPGGGSVKDDFPIEVTVDAVATALTVTADPPTSRMAPLVKP